MRRLTPHGCQRPWRSARNLEAFARPLREGVEPEELVALVEGAAELVTSQRQEGRWWYPENLLGEKTLDRWLGDIAAMREDQARAAARDAELAEAEARSLAERDEATALSLPHLGLRRVVAEAEAAIAARRGGEPSSGTVLVSADGGSRQVPGVDRGSGRVSSG